MTQAQQNLQPLVAELADYITATIDPKKTTKEALALLIDEIKARLDDARGYLGR